MKRFFSFISILAAIAFAASCNIDSIYPDEANGNDSGFTLRLQTASLETKAGVPGVGAENTVTHADFFFFSDEEGTDLIWQTRLAVGDNAETDLVKKGDANIYEHKFGEYTEENKLSGTSYVYVIANYPEEITATTLDDILALDIKTDLSASPTSFVMDSFDSKDSTYVKILKPTKKEDGKNDGEAVFNIPLTRAAAKLVLTVNIAESFSDDAGNDWTPVIDQMWVNFEHARKNAVVKAEPVAFDDKANFYSTARESNTELSKTWTTTAVYTYPQSYSAAEVTAPYYKIFLPWICEKKGLNNFYYKVILPELESFKRNKIYQLTVDVSVIGGTEDDWALVSDYIFVADWWAPDEIEAEFEGAMYLDVPVKRYEIYGIESITVPVVSSNPISARIISATQQYVPETLSEDATKPVSYSQPSVPVGSTKEFTLTHSLTDDIRQQSYRQFDCTPITFIVRVTHEDASTTGFTKYVDVEIVQYPSIYAYLVPGENSFVNGYYSVQTASVSPKPDGEVLRNNRYYGSGQTMAGTGGNNTNTNYGGLNTSWTSGSRQRTTTMTLINVSAFAAGSGTYTVVSYGDEAGQSTKDYIIGDPRVDADYDHTDLNPYLWGNNTQAWTDAAAGTIKKGSDVQKNLIAPAFMFASEIAGRPGTSSNLNFERATKRCATYQEAGYPAGRWRLPTEAEIYFAYSLQNMGVIDNLFNGGDGYYASSGNVFGWDQGDTWTFQNNQNNQNANHSIRCVYDIWYWGDEPDGDLHTYNPGTKN